MDEYVFGDASILILTKGLQRDHEDISADFHPRVQPSLKFLSFWLIRLQMYQQWKEKVLG